MEKKRERDDGGRLESLLFFFSFPAQRSLASLPFPRAQLRGGDAQPRSREEREETRKPKREATSERRRANDRSRHDSLSPLTYSLLAPFSLSLITTLETETLSAETKVVSHSFSQRDPPKDLASGESH